MSSPIKRPSDILPFYCKRTVATGNRADLGSRVKCLKLTDINVDNLKFVPPKNGDQIPASLCSFTDHVKCSGHLQGFAVKNLGFPSFCTVDEDEIVDKRGYANRKMFSEEISSELFCSYVKDTFLTKGGMFRAGLMTFKPLTSCRGVASIVQMEDPNCIYLPRRWMDNMKVPVRIEDTTQGLKTPYYSFRPVLSGDYGVIIRCPVILSGSVQPVRILPWDNNSVGCDASLCDRMNLDFDGDEVHVCIVSSSRSVAEIKKAILLEKEEKFTKERVESVRRHLPEGETNDDFMMSSTCSITELENVSYDSELYTLSRCKESSRVTTLDIHREEFDPAGYMEECYKRIVDIVESQLTVSKKYILSRQLKNLTLETISKDGISQDLWCPSSNNVCMSLGKVEKVFGNPACRFVTKLTQSLIQEALDKSKHAPSQSGSSLANSLVLDIGPFLAVYQEAGELVLKTLEEGQGLKLNAGQTLRICTSRQAIKDLGLSAIETARIVYNTTRYISTISHVTTDESEVLAFSNIIYKTIVNPGKPMLEPLADTAPVRFLAYNGSNVLTSTMCTNSNLMDSVYDDENSRRRLVITNESFLSAIAMGNLNFFLGTSLASKDF
jgi:hypothetical protein